MILVRPSHTRSLQKLFESLRDRETTYEGVGATISGDYPAGYRLDHFEVHLGTGQTTFEQSVLGLQTWQAHHTRRTRVFPGSQPVVEGESMIVLAGFNALAIPAPCRIVKVIQDVNQYGFAYGTLPGHPEQGEELFLVRRSHDGSVRFEIKSFSRPQSLLVKLLGPFGRALQLRATRLYLRALENFVNLQ